MRAGQTQRDVEAMHKLLVFEHAFVEQMKARVGWSRPVGWRRLATGWRSIWRVPAPSRRV